MATRNVLRYNWGTGELVSFKNVDGVPLKGLLLKPDNFDPKKKYPMIVYIYERLSQGLHTFRNPGSGHFDQSDLLRQQRLSRLHA